MDAAQFAFFALVGASVGFLSGLLGIGGGIIMFPLLLYVPPLAGFAPVDVKSITGLTMVQGFFAALTAMSGGPSAELHPQTAARFDVADGQPLTVETRRGAVTVTARVSRDIRPDTVFLPFHWPDGQSANRLTNGALDHLLRPARALGHERFGPTWRGEDDEVIAADVPDEVAPIVAANRCRRFANGGA
mgnify:CR=1 FL=1